MGIHPTEVLTGKQSIMLDAILNKKIQKWIDRSSFVGASCTNPFLDQYVLPVPGSGTYWLRPNTKVSKRKPTNQKDFDSLPAFDYHILTH